MDSIRCSCAVAALLAGPAAAMAQSQLPVAGVVVAVQGQPAYKPLGEDDFEKLKLNQFVYEKGVVKTGVGDRVAVAFVGGAEMRINEDSEFEIQSGGGRKETGVFTKAGQTWARLLHGRAAIRVGSPLAVAVFRGAEGDVDVRGTMTVKVYEGHASIQNEYGKRDLSAGQMTRAAGGLTPETPREMGQDDYGTWQNGLQANNLKQNLGRLSHAGAAQQGLPLKYQRTARPMAAGHGIPLNAVGRQGAAGSQSAGPAMIGMRQDPATLTMTAGKPGCVRFMGCVDGSDMLTIKGGMLTHWHRAGEQIGTASGCRSKFRLPKGGYFVEGQPAVAEGSARAVDHLVSFKNVIVRGGARLEGDALLIDDTMLDGPGVYAIDLCSTP